jgi:hypothetical protein
MRIMLAACAVFVVAAPLRAQERVDSDMIARIKAEGLERSQIMDLFNTLTNVIGPRLPASPQYRQAADWARDRFTAWGLSNAHLEPFEFGRGWTLEKLTLEMTAPRYFPLIGYPEAWTPSTDGVVEGTPVYVGDLDADGVRALGDRLRGAIVLATEPQTEFWAEDRQQPADVDGIRPGSPRGPRRATGPAVRLLQEAGAAAVLRPNTYKHGTIGVLGSRNTQNDAVPAVVMAVEHYNMLVRMTQAGVAPTLRVEVGSRYHEEDTNGYNIIAEIPGTDPAVRDEVVLIGAHIDSWHASSGATDNADGSVGVMEAMRILKAVGAQPRRTIRVALWDAEEQGLLGSRAHVQQHYEGDANAAAREKFYVYFNADPGTGPIYGFYLEDNAAIAPIFDAWLAPLRDLGAKRNVLEGIGSTDHVTFNRAGLPGYNAINDYVDYDVRSRHTNTDFYERVREEDLKQSAIVLAVFAYHAAMREGPLPRVEPGQREP